MAYETQLHLIGERIHKVTVEIVLTECFFSPWCEQYKMKLHHLLQMTFLEQPPSGPW